MEWQTKNTIPLDGTKIEVRVKDALIAIPAGNNFRKDQKILVINFDNGQWVTEEETNEYGVYETLKEDRIIEWRKLAT